MQLKTVKIKSIKKILINEDRYNLEVQDNANYFANNILVHNCRCVATKTNNSISLKSRQGKEFVGLNHIREELLLKMQDGESWDGELYNDDLTFQNIISLVKKDQHESIKIEYHIYDVISDKTFKERFDGISEGKYVKIVDTYDVGSHDEIGQYHLKFVEEGYEGAIIRVGDCPYKAGHRSNKLLKLKNWDDDEFEIVGVKPDVHNEQGMFICKNPQGGTFDVRMKGEDEERMYYLQHPEEFIGKMVTVKFFEFTTSTPPKPRFPTGLKIKEDFE